MIDAESLLAAGYLMLSARLTRLSQTWRAQPRSRFLEGDFWELQRDLCSEGPSAGLWLPAVTARIDSARGTLYDDLVGEILSAWPLPENISTAARPWRQNLARAWQQQTAIHRSEWHREHQRTIALKAEVRLDVCGAYGKTTRLPQWYREFHESLHIPLETGLSRLAALAFWRPAPGATPDAELLESWIKCWNILREGNHIVLHQLATQALLNLAEAGVQLPLRRNTDLLQDMIRHIQNPSIRGRDAAYLGIWTPTRHSPFPPADLGRLTKTWLEALMEFKYRPIPLILNVWKKLIHWEQQGNLRQWGINLLPYLSEVMKSMDECRILRVIATWTPPPGHPLTTRQALHSVYAGWREIANSADHSKRACGWIGCTTLVNAIQLAPEEKLRFWKDYTKQVKQYGERKHWTGLLSMARLIPSGTAPSEVHGIWQEAWLDQGAHPAEEVRWVADWAKWNFIGQTILHNAHNLVGWQRRHRQHLRRLRQLMSTETMMGWQKGLFQVAYDIAAGQQPAITENPGRINPLPDSIGQRANPLHQPPASSGGPGPIRQNGP